MLLTYDSHNFKWASYCESSLQEHTKGRYTWTRGSQIQHRSAGLLMLNFDPQREMQKQWKKGKSLSPPNQILSSFLLLGCESTSHPGRNIHHALPSLHRKKKSSIIHSYSTQLSLEVGDIFLSAYFYLPSATTAREEKLYSSPAWLMAWLDLLWAVLRLTKHPQLCQSRSWSSWHHPGVSPNIFIPCGFTNRFCNCVGSSRI